MPILLDVVHETRIPADIQITVVPKFITLPLSQTTLNVVVESDASVIFPYTYEWHFTDPAGNINVTGSDKPQLQLSGILNAGDCSYCVVVTDSNSHSNGIVYAKGVSEGVFKIHPKSKGRY